MISYRTGIRHVLQLPRLQTRSLLQGTTSSLVIRNAAAAAVIRRGMASSGSHQQQQDSDTPWIIAAGFGSAIGLYFVYGRRTSEGHNIHHTEKQVPTTPSPADDVVTESLKEGVEVDVPNVAKSAEEAPPSDNAPKDDAEVNPVKADIGIEASESSEANRDDEEAGFVKVDAEEAKEIAESVQQELKVDDPKTAKKTEEGQ